MKQPARPLSPVITLTPSSLTAALVFELEGLTNHKCLLPTLTTSHSHREQQIRSTIPIDSESFCCSISSGLFAVLKLLCSVRQSNRVLPICEATEPILIL
jgi:hypothetical protein